MTTAKAVLQFLQVGWDRNFGADEPFVVEFDDSQKISVRGECVTQVGISRTGTIWLRAIHGTYSSDWTSINILENEVVNIRICLPESKWVRAFSLLGNRKIYLKIVEDGRGFV